MFRRDFIRASIGLLIGAPVIGGSQSLCFIGVDLASEGDKSALVICTQSYVDNGSWHLKMEILDDSLWKKMNVYSKMEYISHYDSIHKTTQRRFFQNTFINPSSIKNNFVINGIKQNSENKILSTGSVSKNHILSGE